MVRCKEQDMINRGAALEWVQRDMTWSFYFWKMQHGRLGGVFLNTRQHKDTCISAAGRKGPPSYHALLLPERLLQRPLVGAEARRPRPPRHIGDTGRPVRRASGSGGQATVLRRRHHVQVAQQEPQLLAPRFRD